MAEQVQIHSFELGTEVKLKIYTGWSDYISHRNEVAIIISHLKGVDLYPDWEYQIKWQDDTTSSVKENNIIPVNRDWDE